MAETTGPVSKKTTHQRLLVANPSRDLLLAVQQQVIQRAGNYLPALL
jgi:hypothetical protein